jgi:hypothetical protein
MSIFVRPGDDDACVLLPSGRRCCWRTFFDINVSAMVIFCVQLLEFMIVLEMFFFLISYFLSFFLLGCVHS